MQSCLVQLQMAFRFNQPEILFQTPYEPFASVEAGYGFYLMHSHI